jgi:hypothetical protein
MSNYQVYC